MMIRIILLLAALNASACTASSATITDLPTSNLYFDPSQDFTIAVDYSMSPSISSSSLRDLAFGIGDGCGRKQLGNRRHVEFFRKQILDIRRYRFRR